MTDPAPAPEPTERERRLATAVLALFLLHGILGFLLPWLPAWRMFAIAEQFEYRLTDAQGRAVDLHDYLSRDLYVVNHQLVPLIGIWLAKKYPERAPYRARVERHVGDEVQVWRFQAPGPDGQEYLWKLAGAEAGAK